MLQSVTQGLGLLACYKVLHRTLDFDGFSGLPCEGVDWIQVAQDRLQWQALVNMVKYGEFLDQLNNYQLLKNSTLF
jgi:hypothetical protein